MFGAYGREVIRVMAVGHPAKTAVPPAIDSNNAVAPVQGRTSLRVPVVRRERPTGDKDDQVTVIPQSL